MNPEKNQRTSEILGPRRVPRGENGGGENGGGEDAIGAALRALPAETAGPGFTTRVLARLDEGGRASRPILRPGAAWAALAAAALVAAAGVAVMRSAAPPAASERVAESRPDEPPAVVTDAEAGTAGRHGSTEGGDPASGPGAAPAEDSPSTVPPPAPSDTRLAAAGSAAAGDAHDALVRLRAELDALRREHRRFEIGLADLPEVGRDGQPVVYVGGDEGLGLVLDLGRDTLPGGRGDDRESGTSL